MNWNNIPNTDPQELESALRTAVKTKLPERIESQEDLWEAQKLLSRLASQYAYLTSMAVQVRGLKRKMKRDKEDRDLVDMMMEREELLTSYAEQVKMNYNAISRMLSIRQMVYEELKMTSNMP